MVSQMMFITFYSNIWNSYQIYETHDKNIKVNSKVSLKVGFLLPETDFR